MDVINQMSTKYSTTVICDPDGGECSLSGTDVFKLNPDIEYVLANSQEVNLLQKMWVDFHDNAGSSMHGDFASYLVLMQETAVKNG